jgi:hypothetical protein
MWNMTRLAWLISQVAVAVFGLGALGVAEAQTQGPVHHTPHLVGGTARKEAEDCRWAPSGDEDSPDSRAVNRNTQPVTVIVPAITMLRMDRNGVVIAAATSTGCRPQDGDDVYVEQPDGSFTLTTTIDIDSFHWTGDFTTPGSYQPQRRQHQTAKVVARDRPSPST